MTFAATTVLNMLLFCSPSPEAPNPEPWFFEPMALVEKGECDAALTSLDGVPVSDRPPMWFALSAIANISCADDPDAESRAKAMAVVDEGIRRYPSSANLIWTRGDVLQMLGEHEEAQKEFEKAYDLSKRILASGEKGAGDETEIIARYERQHGTTGGFLDLRLLNLASEALARNDCHGAIDLLEPVPVKTSEEHYSLLAEAYWECWNKNGKESFLADAFRIAKDGEKQFPSSSRLITALGYFWELNGEAELALAHYERAKVVAESNLPKLEEPSAIERERMQLKLINDRLRELASEPR